MREALAKSEFSLSSSEHKHPLRNFFKKKTLKTQTLDFRLYTAQLRPCDCSGLQCSRHLASITTSLIFKNEIGWLRSSFVYIDLIGIGLENECIQGTNPVHT